MGKPRIITKCVANHYTGPNERIIEFASRFGGGLIAFRETPDSRLLVNVYRLDSTVDIVNERVSARGFKLHIKTGNSAFRDESASDEDRDDRAACCAELARIMGTIAGKLVNGQDSGAILDVNGNTVGSFELVED